MFCTRCHRRYDDPSVTACPRDGAPLTDLPGDVRIKQTPTTQTGAILGGRYKIRGLLGKGGMARVYLADDLSRNTVVAVKVMHRDQARDRVACERFLREARAATQIGHPNIIETIEVGQQADGAPYLVLEFLFGEALGDLLRRDEVVEPAFALPLLKQAASALGAAHRAKIIHRDIKPDNLFLVGERGDPYALKVVDFGLAKLTEGSLTKTGTAVGTIEYMPPEQMMTDPLDGRADQYALGVVMYRMFTGVLPFRFTDDSELLAHHLIVPPPRPAQVRPGVAPELEAVILRTLRKVPANRYASMEALVEDIERLLGERPGPVEASAPGAVRDVFVPRGPLGMNAAPYFYRRLGLEPPWSAR
jgi:eukaryotic-like serine/threonine-protein kinase